MPALVFDLGGTHLRCGVAYGTAIQGVTKHRVETYIAGAGYAVGTRDPIVLAFPGPIENRRFALSAPTLYGKTNGQLPDLAGDLSRRTGRDVHILNDVSAATWGLSARTDAKRFMAVTVSSGIGSKLFDR